MRRMWIVVAGPISAATPEQHERNLEVLRRACLSLQEQGHVPILAHDLADPLRALDDSAERQQHYLDLCIALEQRCDAILMVGHSPGADLEMEAFRKAGKPVFAQLQDVPPGA